jgi:hypothetical protein
MFELAKNDGDTATMTFATQNGHVKGGWQGGRGWHRNSENISDAFKPGYLAADKWMIEGVYEVGAEYRVRSKCSH